MVWPSKPRNTWNWWKRPETTLTCLTKALTIDRRWKLNLNYRSKEFNCCRKRIKFCLSKSLSSELTMTSLVLTLSSYWLKRMSSPKSSTDWMRNFKASARTLVNWLKPTNSWSKSSARAPKWWAPSKRVDAVTRLSCAKWESNWVSSRRNTSSISSWVKS